MFCNEEKLFNEKKTKEQKFEAEIFIARLSGEITK